MSTTKLAKLTFKHIAEMDIARSIAIVPIGSMEQHGPHLPIGMDTAVAQALAEAALKELAGKVGHILLPVIPIGQSPEHMDYPGTISFSAETFLGVLKDICASLAHHGFKKILFVNGHGGNISMLGAVSFDVRLEYDVHVFMFNVWSILPPVAEEIINRQGNKTDLHGGELETSMVMHLDPTLVHMEWAVDEENPKFAHGKLINLTGPVTMNWSSLHDIAPSGISGQASFGTPEKGEVIVSYLTNILSQTIEEIDSNW